MATRTSNGNGKKLGKVNGWGIALIGKNGEVELIAAMSNRSELRALKREVYPGSDYKTVKINATLQTYTK